MIEVLLDRHQADPAPTWDYSFLYSEFVSQKYPGIAIFLLGLVFSPVVWFLVQNDLNQAAGQQG